MPQFTKLNIHYIPSVFSIMVASAVMVSTLLFGQAPSMFSFAPKPQVSSANNSVLTATPNPIQVCQAGGLGSSVFSWSVAGGVRVELRKDSQTGQLVHQTTGPGSFTVSGIANGSNYFLYRVDTTTSYTWRYIRGRGWVQVPITTETRVELGSVNITHTQAGCTSSVSGKIPIVSAQASSTYGSATPGLAYDGAYDTLWNGGGFPTRYITFDLGKTQTVSGVRLLTAQSPSGVTTHEVYAGNSAWPNQTKVYTFTGNTLDGQWLETVFTPVSARFVTINTTYGPSWVAWREVEVLGSVPNTSHVQYFGYYANAMDRAGNGNYIGEIKDHTNLAWVADRWVEKITQAKADGMKSVIHLYWEFFDPNTLNLLPDYQQRWAQLSQQLMPYRGDIAAFYVIDEPYHTARTVGVADSVIKQRTEQLIAMVKQTFPEIPHAVYFAYAETDSNLTIPQGYDWVGVDCYGPFNNCFGKSIPEYYNTLKSKMSVGQKLMIVPQAYWPAVSGVTDANQTDILTRAMDYYEFIASEPLTVAVTPFLWQTFDHGTGARDLLRVKNWFMHMGKNISKRP